MDVHGGTQSTHAVISDSPGKCLTHIKRLRSLSCEFYWKHCEQWSGWTTLIDEGVQNGHNPLLATYILSDEIWMNPNKVSCITWSSET